VIAYRFKGQRFDCGSVAGYVEATNHVYHAGSMGRPVA
jgi:UTP--glucose-1-phosphate uridylyltransferase